MKRTLLTALFSLSLLPQAASADVVSDRVFLVTGATGCGTGQSGFKRIKHNPDGSQIAETAEFVVPVGKYLEITNVEYTLPYWTAWAKFYSQSVDVNIRNRSNASIGTNVLSARYGNKATFVEDEADNFIAVGEYVSSGASTNVVAFPVGPLVSPAARLCVNMPSNFSMYGGSVRIRGRLIASGEMAPPPGEVAQ